MTMKQKEALVSKGTKVQIVDSPIPEPNDNQVLIKVVVSGSNPKDWKMPEWFGGDPANTGDDIAGIVEKVGANVFEFKPGDRVAAFHEMLKPHGSFAEYAIAWQHTTFHIPKTTTFEEAATIPLAAMTAALGLYQRLGLPQPFIPSSTSTTPTPLIIYGAASSVGFYGLQLAQRSNIHPILCVAGRAAESYIAPLLDPSKGDMVVDYRAGDEAVVSALTAGVLKAGAGAVHVLDAVSEPGSVRNVGEMFRRVGEKGVKGQKVTFVLELGESAKLLPAGCETSRTMVGDVHNEDKDFGFVWFRLFARGLQEGWFKPQRTEVVPGGLGGVQTALENLKTGKASGVKYVFRIAETEGVVGK